MKLESPGLNEVKMGSSYRTSQGLEYANEHHHCPKEVFIKLMYCVVAAVVLTEPLPRVLLFETF